MSAFLGADVMALERAAVELRAAAEDLDGHNRALTGMLGAIDWIGDLASRFVTGWAGGQRLHLTSTSQFLREAAEVLTANAREQRGASGEGQGPTGGAGLGVCALPAGHVTAGVVRTSFSWGDYISRIEDVADEDAFELLQVSTDPPKYIVLLPGIEGVSTDSVRDLHAAVPARLLQQDAYAARVMAELQRAGVPAGAEVMLMGHSYGAIAAMNLAADPQFNQPGNGSATGPYHLQVTHVVAAGAGVRDWMDRPPEGTDVLMSINRRDHVATAIQAGRTDVSLVDAMTLADEVPGALRAAREGLEYVGFGAVAQDATSLADGRVLHEFTAADDVSGHHYDNYRTGFASAGGEADRWMSDAAKSYFVGHKEMTATRISVRETP